MSKANILVVEDEHVVARDLQTLLQRAGYSVPTVVASGEEAVAWATEARPDLVLMDIVLQGQMDGIEAARQITAHHETPVIYLTAYGDDAMLARAKPTEPIAYLMKPYDERELLASIEMALHQYLARRRRAEEAQRESEQKYRQLVETLQEGVWAIDQDAITTYANPRMAELLGYTVDEMLGESLFSFMDERGREEATRLHERRRQGIREQHDFEFLRKDGSRIYASLETAPLMDEQGNYTGALAGVVDITDRKQAEEALRESEERYRKAQEIGHVGSWEYNIQTAQFWGSDEAKRIYGLDVNAATFTTDQIENCIPERERVHQALVDLIERDQEYNLEFDILTEDTKTRKTIISIASLDRDATNRPIRITGVIVDITERKRAEEQVQRNAARAEALARTAARLNAQLDLDAVLNAVCEETARALNVPAASVSLYDARRETLVCAADCGLPMAYRERALPMPRAIYDAYARQMGPIIAVRDVQAIPGLPNAELYALLDIRTIVGVSMLRDEQLIGGLNIFTFGEARDLSENEVALLQGLADQAVQAIANARLHQTLQAHAATLEQRVAERTAELSQREAALRAANEKLQELDRLKNQFISNVTHDLRTPIAAIKLAVALLKRHPRERHGEYLTLLETEADRQARLVEDILQISRIEAGRVELRRQPLALADLAAAVVASREALANDKGVTLQHAPAAAQVRVVADPDRLSTVLLNLVENAIRYTPAGGQIVVTTGHAVTAGGAWGTVSVTDTGMGIPEADLLFIFDRFYRGERALAMQLPGTGLGLAIVHDLVQLHDGRVTVESTVGQGTAFTVWLPLA